MEDPPSKEVKPRVGHDIHAKKPGQSIGYNDKPRNDAKPIDATGQSFKAFFAWVPNHFSSTQARKIMQTLTRAIMKQSI